MKRSKSSSSIRRYDPLHEMNLSRIDAIISRYPSLRLAIVGDDRAGERRAFHLQREVREVHRDGARPLEVDASFRRQHAHVPAERELVGTTA